MSARKKRLAFISRIEHARKVKDEFGYERMQPACVWATDTEGTTHTFVTGSINGVSPSAYALHEKVWIEYRTGSFFGLWFIAGRADDESQDCRNESGKLG